MTKQIVVLALAMFAAGMHAPARAGALQQWGFKAGYVSAGQDWEHPHVPTEDFSRLSGFQGGVFAEWLDHPVLSVVVAVQYVRKGSENTSPETNAQGQIVGEITVKSKLDYISVPVLLKATALRDGISPYAVAGPRVDFLLGHSNDTYDWGGLEESYDDITWGLSAGVGAETPVSGIGQVFLEFVYAFDLSRVYDTTVQTGEPFRIRNDAFLITIGVGL